MGQELGEGGLILIQGGGNWGDLYPQIHEVRFQYLDDEIKQMCNRMEDLQVVQLGQSVYYGDDYKWRYELATMNAVQNCFTFIARSRESEGQIMQIFNKLQVRFSADPGFMLKPITPTSVQLYDVYFLLRADEESLLFNGSTTQQDILQIVHNSAKEKSFTFGLDFFWKYEKNAQEYRQNIQEEFFRTRYQALSSQINLGKILVTDRLQAAIAAVLMGIPHIWIDTKYKHLSQALYSAFGISQNCDGRLLHSYQAEDLQHAIYIAIQLTKQLFDDIDNT
eukprot:TRINITY_DN5368_c0_g1_i4.p2 TRINITY_DN5368_c0_g1~~TRINITY_DN5368_c0_g1_i4.p2  ORF type:complete len:279 (-),score=32.44 TRINITY_DN5368_c0_g1_i4:660-1496(-)